MRSFSRDPDIVVGSRTNESSRYLSPRAIRVSPKVYRLFFMKHGLDTPEGMQGVIRSATSVDGDVWTIDPDAFLGAKSGFNFKRVLCPDIIRSFEGKWMMHFEGRLANGNAVIAAALSDNCINWYVRAGFCFQDEDQSTSVGSPNVVKVNDELWRMYFHLRQNGSQVIKSAVSLNCLNWEIENGVRITQSLSTESYAAYAPHVVRIKDGTWLMVYSGWSTNPEKTGRILWAISKDGLNWNKARKPALSPECFEDAKHCSEPSLLRLGNGRWKLFYEGCGVDNIWRILAATANNPDTVVH
jgi:predicted GH43/DUF377 family glycosyl hydrolase